MISAPKRERTIVVGGGIVGLACAHYLSRSGREVTVVDRGTIGGGCSHGNCGYICPSHVLPLTEPGAIRTALASLFSPDAPFRIKPRLSPTLWKWLWQFAKRCNHSQMLEAGQALKSILDSSLAEYRRLMGEEALDCEWHEDGLLYVFHSERGFAEFAATDRLLTERFGVAARPIAGEKLTSFEPALRSGLAGAFHYPHDASVRPDLLNAAWAGRLRKRGVTFVENCHVRELVKAQNRIVRLLTSQGELVADEFVFALGAWSPSLSKQLGCRIPIEPGKGYSVTLRRPRHTPHYPMLFPEHRVGVSPFEEGCRLGSIMEFAGYDTSIPERRIDQLRRAAKEYLVEPLAGEVQETWYGWRPMTWDSLPIIGRPPRLANACLATGHNMLGLSLAPATGKLVAELFDGQTTHVDVTPFRPERF